MNDSVRPGSAEPEHGWTYLERLFESAPEGIVMLDGADRVLRANPEFLRMFALREEDAVGAPINRLIIPDDLREEAEELTARVLSGEPLDVETLRLDRQGRRIHVSLLAKPLLLPDGSSGTVAIYRDISLRVAAKRTRQRLLERERAARSAAERAEQRARFLEEVGTVLDQALDYKEGFRRIARMFVPALADYCLIDEVEEDGGLRRVALAHVDPERETVLYRDHRHAPDADPELHPTVRVARSGRPVLVSEVDEAALDRLAHVPEHRAGLTWLNLQSYMIVPLIARGRTLGTITLAMAESGRRYRSLDLDPVQEVARRAALALDNARLYGQAREAVAAREQLLATVSHDLRNPLGSILLDVTSILDLYGEESLPSGVSERLERVARAVEGSDRMIQDLLDVSRIESGGLPIRPLPLAVPGLLQDAVGAQRALAEKCNLDLVVSCSADCPRVAGDAARLQQVFTNLLGNALRLTPAGGEVRLQAQSDGGWVRFAVADTGPGIPPEDLPHIFKPYWQGSGGRRGGGGLGLAIVRGIIEAHGGRVWAEKRAAGGARFVFTLRCAAGAETGLG